MSYSKKGGGLMGRRRKKPKTDMDDGKKEATGTTSKTGAQLRITADFNDLDLPDNVKLIMDEKKNMMDFHMDIHVDMGHWKDAKYKFHFQIPKKYPFEGPKVTCLDKIYHPNIDLQGNVCVSVLRPWKPTYSIQVVLFGLLFLFSNPNGHDPLNNEAAADMRKNEEAFARNVRASLKGSNIDGVRFPKNRGM